jgi:hypothetical protein
LYLNYNFFNVRGLAANGSRRRAIDPRRASWRALALAEQPRVIGSPQDGREERMVGACVDVDERKRTELALGRTQPKLEALAAAAPI